MNWLPIVSIIGLSIAVLVLGWTVVTVIRNKYQHSSPVGEQTRQGQFDAPKNGSETDLPPSVPQFGPQFGFRNPKQTFKEAFMNGDKQSAIAVLPELERVLGPEDSEYLRSAGALAAVGEQRALQPLLNAIDLNAISDESVLEIVLVNAVQYYVFTNRERDGLDKMREVLDRCIHEESRPNEFRASIANQLQRLYFGTEEMDKALSAVELAIQLFPDEPSYYYNLSLIHEKVCR